MQEIRYFGQLVNLASYRRGFGFWGWLANALNAPRRWLEKRIALIILRIECKRAGIDEKTIKAVLRHASLHPEFIPVLNAEDMPRSARKLMRDRLPFAYQTVDERTEARYGEGRKNGKRHLVPFEQGMRLTFAQHQKKHDRSLRYLPERRLLMVHDEHFQPVEASMSDQQQAQPATLPQEASVPNEVKTGVQRSISADFALGANTRHLRVPEGLPKQRK